MAIIVVATPASLAWKDFTPSKTRIVDPSDGTLGDALTRFNFTLPKLPIRKVGGQFAMADPNVITITPNAQVYTGAVKTTALLSHEQFHYDVGIVTARALARELMSLLAPNPTALGTAASKAFDLHFVTRAGFFQQRYDLETVHGTNPTFQATWKHEMTHCLADPLSDKLNGFDL